jgi:hypothetical protein
MKKLRRVMPYRRLTAEFNEEKDNWKSVLFSNEMR